MLPDLLRRGAAILPPRAAPGVNVAVDQKVSTLKKIRFQTGSHH
jgi:hypothetical protein